MQMILFGRKKLKEVIKEKKKHNNTDSLISKIIRDHKPVFDSKGRLVAVKTSRNGIGRLQQESGLNVLLLKGNQMEMGFQHGYLLAEQIQQPRGNPPKNIFNYWSDYIEGVTDSFAPGLGPIIKAVTAPWKEEAVIADRIPDDVFRSIAGLQAGYSKRINDLRKEGKTFKENDLITLFEFIRGYIQPDICNILLNNTIGGGSIAGLVIKDDAMFWPHVPIGRLGCTAVGVLGGKTMQNGLLLGCDFDYGPLAGLWEKNLTLIHFDPLPENDSGEKPQKYMTITTAGSHTAGLIGVNENGVAFRVHNNFTGKTDKRFHWRWLKHGQPVLNFGDYILKNAKSIEGDADLQDIIEDVKKGITCDGRISDSPPSGWAFIVAQHKDSEKGKIIVRETNFKHYNLSSVPAKYRWAGWRKRNRYALIADIPEIESGEDIQTIWQTNFYTSPHFRRKDIFLRKTIQIDNINRFFRVGTEIRRIYPKGKIEWRDIAGILADYRNIFTGNKERLNVGTIASLVNVTSVIFSIKCDSGAKPEIKVYLASQKAQKNRKAPTAWWPYYEFDFGDFSNPNKNDYLKPAGFEYQFGNSPYQKAMEKLYHAYTYYTFTPEKDIDYGTLLDYLLEVEKVFIKTKTKKEMDPFLHFLIGRVYCNLAKKYFRNDQENEVQENVKEAADRFELCLKSNYLYDPHLITLARLYFVRMALNSISPAIRKKMKAIIKELGKDLIYFEEFEVSPVMRNAVKPFLKKLALNTGDKMQYLRDKKLHHVIEHIIKADKYDLDNIEESLTFDGPEPLLYDYQVII
jgi:sulfur relay (sulfurtransferase) DsrC/TusE family protein